MKTYQVIVKSDDKVSGSVNDFIFRLGDFLPRNVQDVTCQLKSVAIPNMQDITYGEDWYLGQGFTDDHQGKILGKFIILEVDFRPNGGHMTEFKGLTKYQAKIINKSYGRPFNYMGGCIETNKAFPKVRIQRPQQTVHLQLFSWDDFTPVKAPLTTYGGLTNLTDANFIFEFTEIENKEDIPYWLYIRSDDRDNQDDGHDNFKVNIPDFLPHAERYDLRLKSCLIPRRGVTVNGYNLYDGDNNAPNGNSIFNAHLLRVEITFLSPMGYSSNNPLKYVVYQGAREGIWAYDEGASENNQFPWMTIKGDLIERNRLQVQLFAMDIENGTETAPSFNGVFPLQNVEFIFEIIPHQDI